MTRCINILLTLEDTETPDTVFLHLRHDPANMMFWEPHMGIFSPGEGLSALRQFGESRSDLTLPGIWHTRSAQ